ncbi:MAG: fructose-1,6-bisphosphatase, partial [Clostridiales bacterium]|nr:fructose-1,6-bisphosphatase [Clostridiales bacterium]
MADRNRGSLTKQDLKYLKLLAHEYTTIEQVSTEIIKLEAILCLPKATEHFISDIHGEYTAFLHMLKSASGVVREKVEILFEDTVPKRERDQLATLIYYPKEKLELLKEERALSREWYLKTLHRLVEVCKLSASKYTRSKVRASLPPQFEFIIAELLNTSDDRMKTQYNNEIFKAILDTEQQDAFIIELAKLIQRLVIDHLHIVGDIFDRGPGAPIILDTLRAYHHVDIQWGNHDILWMGAAAGSRALIATAIINCLKYGNTDTIEAGYGISLRPLMTFALEVYGNDPCERFMPKLVDKNMDPHNS